MGLNGKKDDWVQDVSPLQVGWLMDEIFSKHCQKVACLENPPSTSEGPVVGGIQYGGVCLKIDNGESTSNIGNEVTFHCDADLIWIYDSSIVAFLPDCYTKLPHLSMRGSYICIHPIHPMPSL